ncbi:cartilage intermediate layer protein 2-like [Oryzias latipes]|uniref:cartilage intermediate layer protein 2-like n=1 Tax=Oryzias latipes TaxID=8090 RepID=UPI000CE22F7A|nr:cartilage intermediate layer protein 2-like [Oryzias latipes]
MVLTAYGKTSGFVCRNEDKKEGMCKDYRVRFPLCLLFCQLSLCWTEWFDRDNPSGSGDWELLSDLRKENPGKICETPQYYNPTQGFVCRNEDQTFKKCWDYEVRFGCC